jgi:activator of HSP90 ATPase
MNGDSLIYSKMKRKIVAYFLLILTVSCQVTETLHLNLDGSGSIEVVELRDENSYMQLVKEAYSKEDIFKDTTYVVSDYFQKYSETFNRTAQEDQAVYKQYSNVMVHSKQSSYDKEFRTTISQNFQKATEIADLYKTEDYASDIKNNYALSAEEHYYKVSYVYVDNHFSRIVKITDSTHFKNQVDKIEQLKTYYKGYKLVQNFQLKYYFPRKIQSVSNPLATISADRKSLSLQLPLTDCLQNPEITNLKVVFE